MIVEQDPENASLKIIRQTKAITIIALVKQYLIKPYKNIKPAQFAKLYPIFKSRTVLESWD